MIVAFKKMWYGAKQKNSLCKNLGALVGGRGGSCGDTVEGAGCTPVQEFLFKKLGDMGFGEAIKPNLPAVWWPKVKCDPISGPADWGEGLRGEGCQLVVVVEGEDCQLLEEEEEVVGSQGGGRDGGGRERGEVDTGMLCASPHLQTNN